jgi:predicted SAM-dependent methyltransferase
MAKAYGYQVWGIELSQRRILFAREQGINIMTWSEIKNHQFHFINAEQVFEHVSRPLETLMYLVDSLQPGGLIHLSVPDGRNIEQKLAHGDWRAPKGTAWSLNPVSPLEHVNCFTHTTLIQIARRAGLQRVCIPLFEIAASQNWSSIAAVVKNIVRPFYRNLSGTNLLFSKEG